MGKEILAFGIIEIEKNKPCRHKTPSFLEDVDFGKYQYLTRVFGWRKL